MSAAAKEKQLLRLLGGYDSVLVAFSGGVDSSYLAFVAHRVLATRAVAVTALSPAVSAHQRQLARDFVEESGIRHHFIHTSELDDPNYISNPANRCFFCKQHLYSRLGELRQALGLSVILDGTNRDDVDDYRPGREAARRHGVASPLQEVGFHKSEIRERSRDWGLPGWDLPAMPCLSSRFPYGVAISPGRLNQVEKAEEVLRESGFSEFRVRHYRSTARLEIARSEMDRLDGPTLARIKTRLTSLGYEQVVVDEKGFRSGALNDALGREVTASAVSDQEKEQ